MNEKTFIADLDCRLDVFVAREIASSRSHAAKLIEDKLVAINGKTCEKPGRKVTVGEEVTVSFAKPKPCDVSPEDIPLDVLYDDDCVAVINKPRGMPTHIGAGHYSGTLANALLYRFDGRLSGINGITRPGIVHRLDKDTSGVIAIAKNDAAHVSLSEQLQTREMSRVYRAICHGGFKDETGTIDLPIARHPTDRKKMAVVAGGKRAVTHYTVLARFVKGNAVFTYIECKLETGRTHQIRVHMARVGRPIVGDAVYGSPNAPFAHIGGQALHAKSLTFRHPVTGEAVEVCAPLPEYFIHLLETLDEKGVSKFV